MLLPLTHGCAEPRRAAEVTASVQAAAASPKPPDGPGRQVERRPQIGRRALSTSCRAARGSEASCWRGAGGPVHRHTGPIVSAEQIGRTFRRGAAQGWSSLPADREGEPLAAHVARVDARLEHKGVRPAEEGAVGGAAVALQLVPQVGEADAVARLGACWCKAAGPRLWGRPEQRRAAQAPARPAGGSTASSTASGSPPSCREGVWNRAAVRSGIEAICWCRRGHACIGCGSVAWWRGAAHVLSWCSRYAWCLKGGKSPSSGRPEARSWSHGQLSSGSGCALGKVGAA